MLSRIISRYWLLIPLLVLAIVVRDWVETSTDATEIEATIDMSETQSDYYLEDFTTRKYDTNGEIQYEVRGNSLAHYPDDNSSEISRPTMVMHRDDARWEINSRTGELAQSTGVFTLIGDVMVLREAQQSAPIQMKTSRLSVLTDGNQVVTDEPIEIISENWELRSVGLQSTLEAGKLNLLSQVTGHYEPAQSE